MRKTQVSRPLICIATTMLLWSGNVLSGEWPMQGTTNYVIHYVMQPINTIDEGSLGKVVALEMVGTTANMDGGKMMDKMVAHCLAVKIEAGTEKYMNGGCTMTDQDNDKIFTTFDTRELEGALPKFTCGTHNITGGSGKYTGISGKERFNCNILPATTNERWTGIDIEHQMTYSFE